MKELYFVIENYKGLCEHNFVGTWEDLKVEFNVSDEEMDEILQDGCYYSRPNVSYDIYKCSSNNIYKYLRGALNDVRDDKDWYWSNDYRRFGNKAMEILNNLFKVQQLNFLCPRS